VSSTVPKLRAPREPEIRAGLKAWIAETLGPRAAVIDELAIKHGKYRVDVCAITDRLHGYEIKSDQDTLKRLPAQSKHFSLVFHRMTLVIGPGLLGPAIAEVPHWWGIMLVTRDRDGGATFTVLREAQENPKPNYRWVVRLLWRGELTTCLNDQGVRGYSKLKYWQVANLMLDSFTPQELTERVTQGLRERKGPMPPDDADGGDGDEASEAPEPVVGYDAWESTDNSYWDDDRYAC
jgi:hypothetical protein